MTYFGRPEDLEEPEMSPAVRRLADEILPLNRERIAELGRDFDDAMHQVAQVILSIDPTPIAREFTRFLLQVEMAEFRRHGLRRPDGRPRGSGHRHRGMRAWRWRHG